MAANAYLFLGDDFLAFTDEDLPSAAVKFSQALDFVNILLNQAVHMVEVQDDGQELVEARIYLVEEGNFDLVKLMGSFVQKLIDLFPRQCKQPEVKAEG